MSIPLAHLLEVGADFSALWIAAVVTAALVLTVEHHIVAGFDRRQSSRTALGLAGFALVCVTVSPALLTSSARAQSSGPLLPDLISDPPNPSYFNELNTADGQTRLVVTFDGYVHNIGEGALDVVGNPQQANGMEQRVRNGDTWETVGTPTVRFETDDGHNHFHLIEAIEYVLWDELQGSQTAIGSKIGFCLVDSELMEPGQDQAYSEELDNFCQENNPGATSLRMGITPGWRDIYDATTTLQWVDVSNVAPGRYWIGAITDPNDEILESNEANNDLVFSSRTIAVPGYAPRSTEVSVDGQATSFALRANTYGTVGVPVFVIEEGPQHGFVSVPIGAALDAATVVYTPDPGYEGSDSLRFSVRDATSPYPFDAVSETVTFDVSGGSDSGQPRDGIAPPTLTSPSTFFESTVGERFEVDIVALGGDGQPAALHATNLPAGLIADSATGTISGVPIDEGIFDVELAAMQSGLMTTQQVSWIVNSAPAGGGLNDVADLSSPRGELTRLRVGAGLLGAQFEAIGLPDGLSIDPTAPLISGTPTEVGSFDVEVRQLDGDDVVARSSFVWTVRPTIDIEFPL